MNKLLTPTLALIALALTITLLFSHVKQSNLEEENRSLRKQLENLTADRPLASATTSASDPSTAPNLDRETTDTELVRLRGEVTNLRREKQELEKLRAENQTLRAQNEDLSAKQPRLSEIPIPKTYPRENWAFTGFADPESAIQSLLWAGANGNGAAALAALTPEQIARMKTEDNRDRSDEEIAAELAKQIAKVKSFQVLKTQPLSENETVLTLYIDGLEGSEQTPRMKMQRINNEWRLAGPYRAEESKQQ
jgi:hypothetical protein